MAKVLKVLKMLKVLNFWGVGNSNIFTFTDAALQPHSLRASPGSMGEGDTPLPPAAKDHHTQPVTPSAVR